MSEILSEHEVSLEKLESLFKAAFLRTERDSDGDLVIRDESGVKTFVKIDKEKKLISFFSIWGLSDQIAESAKLKFVNELNDGLILVRFSLPRPTMLWCDYQFFYEGGIIPYQMIHTYRRFVSVCRGAPQRDTMKMFT